MAQFIAPIVAYAQAPLRQVRQDSLRTCIVCGCAMALIAAGQMLPI